MKCPKCNGIVGFTMWEEDADGCITKGMALDCPNCGAVGIYPPPEVPKKNAVAWLARELRVFKSRWAYEDAL